MLTQTSFDYCKRFKINEKLWDVFFQKRFDSHIAAENCRRRHEEMDTFSNIQNTGLIWWSLGIVAGKHARCPSSLHTTFYNHPNYPLTNSQEKVEKFVVSIFLYTVVDTSCRAARLCIRILIRRHPLNSKIAGLLTCLVAKANDNCEPPKSPVPVASECFASNILDHRAFSTLLNFPLSHFG